MFRRMMCLLVAVSSFTPTVLGQGTPTLTPQAQLTHDIRIPAGTSSFSNGFWVAKSTSMHLSLLLPTNDYTLTLINPTGASIVWDPASTTIGCVLVPLQGANQTQPIAYMYHYYVPFPSDGTWTLQASSPTINPTDWITSLSADFLSSLNVAMTGTSTDVVVGHSIAVSFVVNDQGTARTDIACTGGLSLDTDPLSAPQAVAFRPVVDPTTGATTFVAIVSPSMPGNYTVTAAVTGSNGTGSFERVSSFLFTVSPSTAILTGAMTQRAEINYPASPNLK